ncbi:MAG: ParB/RepB/Spo0J family partition protein [Clostridia bacterium]|jgi:ParB family chromosome partitioning protein
MVKKTGLGKGLEALFNENQLTKEEEMKLKNGEEIVQNLKLIDIEPNRDQPRRTFNSESLEELATSIKRYGVIQPIIVTKMDNYYQIVAGERRWRAAKKAGLMEIPCLVRDSTERKNREIALIENIQREDLNPIDKALGFRQLLEEYGMTQQELSDTVGIGRSTLANNLRILNLDERVQNLAREGKISEGHCRQLLCYEDPDKQYKMALKIIETGDSVRDIERKVRNKKAVEKQKDKKYEAIYRDIEDTFQSFFGTKVKLDAKQKSGKIIIKYSSNEELERILELIRNDGNE